MCEYFYRTPEGFSDMILGSKDGYLTRLEFVDDVKHSDMEIPKDLKVVCEWLERYFAGEVPRFLPKYQLEGLSRFTKEVLQVVARIPYGETMTYGNIAEIIRKRYGKKISARAVGAAVGRNPIGIIVPCHRVVGADGKMVGYNGGLQNKLALLEHEHLLCFGGSID